MKLFRNSVFRDFHHLRDITKPEYRHALLMLFWLIDLPMFFVIQAVVRDYTVIRGEAGYLLIAPEQSP